MSMIGILVFILTFILCIPALFMTIEILGSFLPNRYRALTINNNHHNDMLKAGPIFIVVPAHNEGENIRPTLRDIRAQLRPIDKLIVVADNCTDNTTIIAREEGAHCIERSDPTQRGKGYAIEFALNHIHKEYNTDQTDNISSPPESLVLIDADSQLTPNLLSKLAHATIKTQRPVQALYLMNPPTSATDTQVNSDLRIRVSAFAWLLINQIRMSGLGNIFDTTRLTGSGMAFPWDLIQTTFKGSGNIVEDLAFTIDLTVKGHSPLLLQEAKIYGTFPSSQDGAATQRARWELGSLSVARKKLGPLFIQGITKGNIKIIATALDIAIPPLVILVFTTFLTLIISILIALFFGFFSPLYMVAFSFSCLCCALMGSWFIYGRDVLPANALPGILAFIVEKFKVYGRKGRQSTKTWTRTKRD